MKPTEEETKRYYHSFINWLATFHPLEALQAKIGQVDRQQFNSLIREWAQTITKGNK